MILVIMLFASFVILVLLWAFRVVPFVKRFTGGRSGRILFNNTVMYSDFLLALKIVRKEGLHYPAFLKVFALICVLQIIMLMSLFIMFLSKM